MAFYVKIHKWEESVEQQMTDWLFETICETYGVEEVTEVSKEQYDEIMKFYEDEVSEYSCTGIAFTNFMNQWDDENG